jgi:hypothetical protein
MEAHTNLLFTNIFQIKLGLPSIDRWYWCVYNQLIGSTNIHLIWCVHSEHTCTHDAMCDVFASIVSKIKIWWFLNSCLYLVMNILIYQTVCWHDLFERWGLHFCEYLSSWSIPHKHLLHFLHEDLKLPSALKVMHLKSLLVDTLKKMQASWYSNKDIVVLGLIWHQLNHMQKRERKNLNNTC